MIVTGVKDAKNRLSRYLAHVIAGEDVLITKRGKPVARIVKEDPDKRSIRAALIPLLERGLIALPTRRLEKARLSIFKVSGKPVSEMVIEDRR